MSSSTSNLLSVAGNPAQGKIVVKNADTKPIAGFNIAIDNNVIAIDPASSCYGPVAAGGQCTFDISYVGAKNYPQKKITPILVKIGNEHAFTDFVTIRAIDMPDQALFIPYADETTAAMLNFTHDVVAFVTTNKNGVLVLYVGSDGGGIAKTTDGGTNWMLTNNGLKDLHIKALCAIDKGVDAGLYVGTENGVFKSTNGGASWQKFGDKTIENKAIASLYAINEGMAAGLYAITAGDGKIYKCSNNVIANVGVAPSIVSNTKGETVSLNKYATKLLAVNSGSNAGLYAGTYEGIYKTPNNNFKWRPANGGSASELENLEIQSIDIIYQGINAGLYVGTAGGVFKTTDGGNTWAEVLSGVALKSNYVKGTVFPEENYIRLYAIEDGPNAALYVRTKTDIFKTTDGGSSWEKINPPQLNTKILSLGLVIDGKDLNIYVGTAAGGVFKTTSSGQEWVNLANELANEPVQALHLGGEGVNAGLYVGTTNRGVFKSVDGGANWQRISNGLDNMSIVSLCSIDDGENAGLYAGTYAELYKSSDGGVNWQKITAWREVKDLMCSDSDCPYMVALQSITSGKDEGLYAAFDNGTLLKSVDGGATWQLVTVVTSMTSNKRTDLHSFYIMGTEPNIKLYALLKEEGIMISGDSGKGWYSFNNDDIKNGSISSLFSVNNGQRDNLYAILANKYLFSNTNDVASGWSKIDNFLICIGAKCQATIHSTLFIHEGPNTGFYIGTDMGLFKSSLSL